MVKKPALLHFDLSYITKILVVNFVRCHFCLEKRPNAKFGKFGVTPGTFGPRR